VGDITILYASTSGSTRFIVEALVDELAGQSVEHHDISTLDKPIPVAGRDLIVLVTPTYGTGDWHYAWDDKGAMLLADLPPQSRVALLTLGDSRGHKKSFAGGMAKLATLARSRDAVLVGAVSTSDYTYESSRAAENGTFPGLVVEYRKNRHAATKQAREWIRGLV
jgi:flavodoxin I